MKPTKPETHHIYRGFDLVVDSPLQLWKYDESAPGAKPDASVSLGHVVPCDEDSRFDLHATRATLCLPGRCLIHVADGREIRVDPAPNADHQTLGLAAAGAGLAMLLHQRGHLVLHGACVRIAGVAICLIGSSGMGKSSLAAHLRTLGHTIVSDAMVAIELRNGRAYALRGPGHQKLWPDSIARLGYDARDYPRVTRAHSKAWVPSPPPAERVTPIEYVLELRGEGPVGVSSLKNANALMALVRNCFLAQYMSDASADILLRLCAQAAACVQVGVLDRGASPDTIEAACAKLERLLAP